MNAMPTGYDRAAAIAYARRWAFSRNPAYLDFHGLGGDCTNYVSQCLYAGCGVMNYTPVYGWYYITANDRTASWTGVEYFRSFITQNTGAGPYAREVSQDEVGPGDVVILGLPDEPLSHTALIAGVKDGELYLAAHTIDAWLRPLSAYRQPVRVFLRVEGARGGHR